VEWFYMG
jgi:putative membrane protein insertion efficiency factor/ribonuclease P protein component